MKKANLKSRKLTVKIKLFHIVNEYFKISAKIFSQFSLPKSIGVLMYTYNLNLHIRTYGAYNLKLAFV